MITYISDIKSYLIINQMMEIEVVSEMLSFSTSLLWLITKILADFSVFIQHR